jgi:hypothetical protein
MNLWANNVQVVYGKGKTEYIENVINELKQLKESRTHIFFKSWDNFNKSFLKICGKTKVILVCNKF